MWLILSVLGVVGLAYPAWITARRLRFERPTLTLLATVVLAWAALVLVADLLSLAGTFDRRGILLAELVLAAATLAINRHHLAVPRLSPRRAAQMVGRLRSAGPEYAILAGVLAAALAVNLVLAVTVAPNTPASLSYHLSRAAYWVQEGSVFHFHGAEASQAAMPPNGEIALAWLLALGDRDTLVQLVQYLAYLVVIAGVYEGARLLRFEPRMALFAALLFGAMPQPLLQASSTQNDLVAAAALIAATVFATRGLRSGRRPELALAAAAIGLAAGTKVTALTAVPAVAVLAVVLAWPAVPRRRLAALAGAMVMGALILAAPNYIQNQRDFGDPLGPPESATAVGGDPRTPRTAQPQPGDRLADISRTAWTSFVQTVPIDAGWVGDALEPAARAADEKSADPVRAAIDEDLSGYGLLGLAVFIPCWLYALLRGPRIRRAAALAAAIPLGVVAAAFPYSLAAGRIVLPFAVLAAPLLALAAARRWTRAAAAALACAAILPVVLVNPSKPVLRYDGTTVFQLDRVDQLTRRGGGRESLTAINAVLPHDSTLGLYGRDTTLDYPLFGDRLQRRLVRVVRGVDDERRGIVDGHPVQAIYYAGTRPPRGSQALPLPGGDRLVLLRGPVSPRR